MIVFIDVKVAETVVNVGDKSFSLIPVTNKWFKGELRGLYELFAKGGSVEGVDIDFKGGEYPDFYIDAGFLHKEVVDLVKGCDIPNVFAVKGSPKGINIIASSMKSHKKLRPTTSLSGTKAPTHQEKIELIYALSSAIQALNGAQSVAKPINGVPHKCPLRTAAQEIAKELSKLISPQD